MCKLSLEYDIYMDISNSTYSTNIEFSGTWECHGSLCRL